MYNQNKMKEMKTVCIIYGIYCVIIKTENFNGLRLFSPKCAGIHKILSSYLTPWIYSLQCKYF